MNTTTQQFTDANFDSQVLQNDRPVLVDFWAEWCGPCRAIGPVIDELSAKFEGKAVVGKLNIDANQETAQRFGVESLPTVVIFQSGEIVETLVGARPLERYVLALNDAIQESHPENNPSESSPSQASCNS